MAKHIHRISKDDEYKKNQSIQDLSEREEWKFLSGMEPRPDSLDSLSDNKRSITFSNKSHKKSSNEERVNEKLEEFKDQVTNTEQYIRFANEVIKEKMNRLKQLKDDEKKFYDEVDILQNRLKSRNELDKLNPKYLTESDAKALIIHLEEEYEKMKDNLLYQEIMVQKTKDSIAAKRKQTNQIKEELRRIIQRQKIFEITDPIAVLKDELKKAGVDEKNKIFQIIDDFAKIIDMKNLKNQSNKD
ncbi:MAG: hypothetical protein ACT4NT_01210 [Nitrososphaerota archaeon]